MKNNKIVNAAIQVLPLVSTENKIAIIDKAIQQIEESGLRFQVCPFETVVEGTYADIMDLISKIHDACYNNGTQEMIVNIKIHSSLNSVYISDKMEKYQ